MYLTKSLIDGLKILGFDRETIKTVSKERSLEEVFLSTLFLNYIIVLIIFTISMITGPINLSGRELNMPVLYGILMMYPFIFNLIVYVVYGFFGLMAEMLNNKNHIKPLISVGFHTAIVYTVIIYLIGLTSLIDVTYSLFLLTVFILYFIYTMFLSISTIYEYSFAQSLIIVLVPFLLIGIILLITIMIYPEALKDMLYYFA